MQEKSQMSFFYGSILFTIISLVIGFSYGAYTSGMIKGFEFATTMAILGVLEVSLSFDNAIANAKVLKTMSEIWQQRFLTWGMAIAVFGMRVFFPLLIVAITAGIGMYDALIMALNDPTKYSETLTSAHIEIAGFGGAFLLLVALNFFLDIEKDEHWIHIIEEKLSNIGRLNSIEVILTLSVVLFTAYFLPAHEKLPFIISGTLGVIVHELIKGLGDLMNAEDEAGMVIKSGVMSFLYLEVLDASFSFDGVIGAFVISNNIIIIALGLGIGSMFVRSMTLLFVKKDTLATFKYLEHGAFWSILFLAIIMFTSTMVEIPEIVTGGLSVSFIAAALYHSMLENKLAKT